MATVTLKFKSGHVESFDAIDGVPLTLETAERHAAAWRKNHRGIDRVEVTEDHEMPTNHLGFDFSSVNRLWLRLDAERIDNYVAAERLFGADDEFTQGALSSLTKDVTSLVWC